MRGLPLLRLCITVSLIFAATPQPAFAYLDPGTASLILQGIVGAIGAGLVAVSMYGRRLLGFFKNEKSAAASREEPTLDVNDAGAAERD